MEFSRRKFILNNVAGAIAYTLFPLQKVMAMTEKEVEKWSLTASEWRKKLTLEQYNILREAGTEASKSSELNNERRAGTYACAGCGLALFTSEMKYDSGTGWPSFTKHINGAIETKLDFKLIYPRKEYHCSRCKGHQGHVFSDGPKPLGKRWCNNGLALNFKPTT